MLLNLMTPIWLLIFDDSFSITDFRRPIYSRFIIEMFKMYGKSPLGKDTVR